MFLPGSKEEAGGVGLLPNHLGTLQGNAPRCPGILKKIQAVIETGRSSNWVDTYHP